MVLLKEKAVSDAQSVTFGGRSGERSKHFGVISIREHIFSKLLQRDSNVESTQAARAPRSYVTGLGYVTL